MGEPSNPTPQPPPQPIATGRPAPPRSLAPKAPYRSSTQPTGTGGAAGSSTGGPSRPASSGMGQLSRPQASTDGDALAGQFVNNGRDCLTYETLFNQRKFRKTNQKRPIGLYRMPLARVKLFVCQGISQNQLKQLVDAFFPDLAPEAVVALSRRYCPWQPAAQAQATADVSSPSQLVASRGDNVVHIGVSVVMPYNFKDNIEESRAIGTHERSHFGATLIRLKDTWSMWNTASRSSIVKISRVKPTGAPWRAEPSASSNGSPSQPGASKDADGPYEWPFGAGDPDIDQGDIAGSQQFKLSDAADCYSVKTGVAYIGTSEQYGSTSGNKDVLEENSLDACLRSDYISVVDEEMHRDAANDPDLLLLKELLTITEKCLEPGREEQPGDGMQVRDISVLKTDKIYFPPLSIPFVDLQLKTLTRRYQEAPNENWARYWKDAYAAALGRAKALLLLRYALQPGSPNAQNFLLELGTDLKPTGCVVVRDLGDAQLHREVAWALYGPSGAPLPAGGDAGWDGLSKLNLAPLTYECTTLRKIKGYIMETGVIDPSGAYGKVPGTQMRWTAFSALSKGRLVATAGSLGATDHDVRAAGWQRVLEVNAEWGRAHAGAFISTVEACLGLRCGVDLGSGPDPKRYGRLGPTDYSQAGDYYEQDLNWEEAASGTVHRVIASAEGQKAIRDYKQRGWKVA